MVCQRLHVAVILGIVAGSAAIHGRGAPEPDDTVVETEGARVFVDPVASVALNDRVLDARVSDDGSVGFALAQQR